jgi:methyltransferase (TIGR00027 family)
MKEGRASRTAEYMALFRALEMNLGAERRICEDRFAAAFLSAPLRLVVTLSKSRPVGALIRGYIDYRWPGARTSAVARTRFIDDVAAAALARGSEQVVILGAGFDARAYRIAAMSRVPVFEVDHPSTSAAKRSIMESVLNSIPQRVRFVPIDFNSQQLPDMMKAAGYDADRPTLFIWEGVTNYLTEDAVDRTLRWCASAAGGSRVAFTYVDRHVLDTPEVFYGTRKLFATLRNANERWTFGWEPSHLFAYVASRGLVLDENLGAAEYRSRCFGRAAAHMRGYEFYRIAVAHVVRPEVGSDHGDRFSINEAS